MREVLVRIGDKWSVLVIGLLGQRGRRFTELLHDVDGISQRMLTVTLRGLERDGLVSRTVHAVVPRVESVKLWTLLGSTSDLCHVNVRRGVHQRRLTSITREPVRPPPPSSPVVYGLGGQTRGQRARQCAYELQKVANHQPDRAPLGVAPHIGDQPGTSIHIKGSVIRSA